MGRVASVILHLDIERTTKIVLHKAVNTLLRLHDTTTFVTRLKVEVEETVSYTSVEELGDLGRIADDEALEVNGSQRSEFTLFSSWASGNSGIWDDHGHVVG